MAQEENVSNPQILPIALAGMSLGALTQAFGEMAKELRRYAGSDFNKCLDNLERQAIRSVENAAIDSVPENDQLFLIEQTRAFIAAKFGDIRNDT